eukprot:g13583.t1
MFVDGFTKPFRCGLMWLLHAAANLGLIDQEMMNIVQRHIAEVLDTEGKKKEMQIVDLVKKMEDDGDEDVQQSDEPASSEIPIVGAGVAPLRDIRPMLGGFLVSRLP